MGIWYLKYLIIFVKYLVMHSYYCKNIKLFIVIIQFLRVNHFYQCINKCANLSNIDYNRYEIINQSEKLWLLGSEEIKT